MLVPRGTCRGRWHVREQPADKRMSEWMSLWCPPRLGRSAAGLGPTILAASSARSRIATRARCSPFGSGWPGDSQGYDTATIGRLDGVDSGSARWSRNVPSVDTSTMASLGRSCRRGKMPFCRCRSMSHRASRSATGLAPPCTCLPRSASSNATPPSRAHSERGNPDCSRGGGGSRGRGGSSIHHGGGRPTKPGVCCSAAADERVPSGAAPDDEGSDDASWCCSSISAALSVRGRLLLLVLLFVERVTSRATSDGDLRTLRGVVRRISSNCAAAFMLSDALGPTG